MKLSMVVAVLALAACEGKSTPTSKTPEPTPTPAAATCKDDSDCVISCEGKGSCCIAPCCETAILSSEANAIASYNRDHCPKNPQCPTVGGCQMAENVTAKCQAGACVAVKTPRPMTFGVAPCSSDADCTVVNLSPCDKCGCAQTPIVKTEEQRAKDYAASISCDQKVPDNRVCGECMPAQVTCKSGACVTK